MAIFKPEVVSLKNNRKFTFRNLAGDDAQAFIDLRVQSGRETNFTYQYEGGEQPSEFELATRLDAEAESDEFLTLGAFEGEQLIGVLGARKSKPGHPWTEHIAYFGMMVLAPCWGLGVGRALLDRCKAYCKDQSITKLEGHVRERNYRAQYLYLSSGFKFEGRRVNAVEISGEYQDEYFLGWRSDATLPEIHFRKEGQRCIVKPLWLASPISVLKYQKKNKEHLAAFGPAYPEGFFTEDYWWNQKSQSLHEFYEDKAVRFVVAPSDDHTVVIGTVNFTQIFRGCFQACFCGFGLDEDWQGNGVMTEALRLATDYMFECHGLHRIMANHFPDNLASKRVLEKVGFEKEGQAKDYLHLGGEWRDHEMRALVNPKA